MSTPIPMIMYDVLPDSRPASSRRTRAERVENPHSAVEKISLVPMNGVGTDFCERLAPCLEERFFHKFAVEKPLTLSLTQANSARRQFFLNTVFNRMLAAFPRQDGMLLGIMAGDLYKTAHNFIFG